LRIICAGRAGDTEEEVGEEVDHAGGGDIRMVRARKDSLRGNNGNYITFLKQEVKE
jgi:hypothetical protein